MTTIPTSEPAATDRPDPRDLLLVHRLFRRELPLLPCLVHRTSPADLDRRALVAAWVGLVVGVLHRHHTDEDELVWARLAARAPEHAATIERVSGQHDEIACLLDEALVALRRWRDRGDEASREALTKVLAAVPAAQIPHLDEEEAELVPLLDRLSAAEVSELSERGRAALPPESASLFLGALLEDATPDEEASVLDALPLAARAAWTVVGRRAYAREMRRLRAGCTAGRTPRAG